MTDKTNRSGSQMMGVCGNVATDDFFKHKKAWVLGDVIGLNTIILDLDFRELRTFNQFGPSVFTGFNCLNPCKYTLSCH